MLLRGGVRVTPALSEGDAGGEGLPEHSRARCGRQAGRAVQGSLPLRAGKCDSELWELGLESSQGSMSGEAAESVTPLYVLVMAALEMWGVLKNGTKDTKRVASKAAANRDTGKE